MRAGKQQAIAASLRRRTRTDERSRFPPPLLLLLKCRGIIFLVEPAKPRRVGLARTRAGRRWLLQREKEREKEKEKEKE